MAATYEESTCEICTANPDSCSNLHIFYLIGAILTIVGCGFVMITYSCYEKLRRHPSVLIFSRCIFDFLFGVCFFVQYFLDPVHLACNPKHCNWLGGIILFCFLCSQGFFGASIYDLYISLSNPFSQPQKLVLRMYVGIVLTALVISLGIHKGYSYSYRIDLQYCAISTFSDDINPYNLIFIYLPITALIFVSLAVNIYAFRRLRVGLEDTFYARMAAIKDSLVYCLGFMLYFAVLGLCYFMVWNDDKKYNDSGEIDENGWHYVFALSVAFLGLNDFGLWVYRQFTMFNTKQKDDKQYQKIAQVESLNKRKNMKKRRNHTLRRNTDLGKQYIAPALPQHIAYMESTPDSDYEEKENKCAQCCKRISLKPTVGADGINKALRREVLAYTTDGIAQSIDRQFKLAEKFDIKNGLNDADYPTSIDDAHGRTAQRFGVVIKHNKHLLYEDQKTSEESQSSLADDVSLDDADAVQQPMAGNNAQKSVNNDVILRVPTSLILETDEKGIGKRRECVDYAPLVFKYIRNNVLGISDRSYNASIIPSDKYAQRNVLDAKYGEGKSGAFFYFTHDNKYLVKTIKKFEVEVMLNTLKDYVKYVTQNPNTILSRTVGLHSVRLYGLTKYFVVSENVFLAELKPSEIYDLKGSWVNRYTSHSLQSGKTMKDCDLKRFIVVKKDTREQLINQLQNDSLFLSKCNIMDYSLLLGIYSMKVALNNGVNKQNDDDEYDSDDDEHKHQKEKRQTLKHYAGGIRAEIMEGAGLYYMGIIDTLQVYNTKKKMETFMKTYIKRDDGNGISCVEPIKYQKRFMNYMKNIIVTDEEYYKELDVSKMDFQNQNVLIYPGKKIVDRSMKEAQSRA